VDYNLIFPASCMRLSTTPQCYNTRLVEMMTVNWLQWGRGTPWQATVLAFQSSPSGSKNLMSIWQDTLMRVDVHIYSITNKLW